MKGIKLFFSMLIVLILAFTITIYAEEMVKEEEVTVRGSNGYSILEAVRTVQELILSDQYDNWNKAEQILRPYLNDASVRKLYNRLRIATCDFISPFYHDAAIFMVKEDDNEKWGMISSDGTIIAEPVYSDIGGWSSGLKWIDKMTNNSQNAIHQAVTDTYYGQMSFSDGLIEASYETPVDVNDLIEDPTQIDEEALSEITEFFNGWRLREYCYLKPDGSADETMPKYIAISEFYEGKALVRDDEGAAIIDTEGRIVQRLPELNEQDANGLMYGKYIGGNLVSFTDNSKSGLARSGIMDFDGNVIIEANKMIIGNVHKGTIIVDDADNNYGMIDSTGKVLIPFKYKWMGYASDNLVLCRSKKNAFSLFDLNGKAIKKTLKINNATKFETLGFGYLAGYVKKGYFITDVNKTVYKMGKKVPYFSSAGISRLTEHEFFAAKEDKATGYSLYKIEGNQLYRVTEDEYPMLFIGEHSEYFPVQSKNLLWDILDEEGKSTFQGWDGFSGLGEIADYVAEGMTEAENSSEEAAPGIEEILAAASSREKQEPDRISFEPREVVLYAGQEEPATVKIKLEPDTFPISRLHWHVGKKGIFEYTVNEEEGTVSIIPLKAGKTYLGVYTENRMVRIKIKVKERT